MSLPPAILAKLPVEYRAARQAMAALVKISEANTERHKAVAMEVYAFQAKDVELVAPAVTTRKHAERRIGQLMTANREAGLLAKAGRKPREIGISKIPIATLAAQGVDKNLANRARTAAALSEAKFEVDVRKAIRIAVAAIQHHTEVIKEARAERHAIKKARRAKRERDLTKKIKALPQEKFGVILADPEWKWEAWSEKGLDNTSADNHYPTSDLDTIKARDVARIAADDCALFLWATVPMLPQALDVMLAWGFRYVSNFVWVKDRAGTGYWSRNQHELLLIGTRGEIPAPLEGTQWPSVINAPRGKHSAKPVAAYELIEHYYPTLPKVELNARAARVGWARWGNEAPAEAAE